jgi:hypothetical protein
VRVNRRAQIGSSCRRGFARRLALSLAIALIFCSSWAAVARADEAPSIWYRSSEGCPDGSAFVARLHGSAEGARLATAGDRIDFVVTLGVKEGHAFGRLERQTSEGRVAIRELDASRCDEVADAIALTLTLTLAPQTTPALGSSPTNSSPVAEAPEPQPVPPTEAPPASVEAKTNVAAPTRAAAAASTANSHEEPTKTAADGTSRWRLGADVTVAKGSLPDLLPGLRLFLELRTDAPWRGSSARVAAFLTKRAPTTDPNVDVLLAGGRLEVSPVALFGPVVELVPSVALDLGWVRAQGTTSTGLTDSGIWAAVSATARGVWHVNRTLSLEAELGPSVPFTSYELVDADTGATIHHTEVVGFSAAIGAGIGLP